jgi:hypothetical protein
MIAWVAGWVRKINNGKQNISITTQGLNILPQAPHI